MRTELPSKVMLGQTLVLMQMTLLNNVRKVGRLVLYRTSGFFIVLDNRACEVIRVFGRLIKCCLYRINSVCICINLL
jgi:hypothetical protein